MILGGWTKSTRKDMDGPGVWGVSLVHTQRLHGGPVTVVLVPYALKASSGRSFSDLFVIFEWHTGSLIHYCDYIFRVSTPTLLLKYRTQTEA